VLKDRLLAPTGHFLLKVYRKGILIDKMDEKNLIVVGSQAAHAHLLGGDVANRSVTQISYGTSGTGPVFGNTTITSPYTKALDSVIYPASNQVQFNFSLGAGEDNPQAILEFGLLTAGNVLYARKVRSAALNKDTDVSLTGSWTISF
jgi:hypothetical protein